MDFTAENPRSVSSVGVAVRSNDVEAIRRAIARGRSIDLKDNRGWAAIHCAASLNYTDCLKVLLEAGADINIRTHEGESPLFLACARKSREAVKILLEKNCSVTLPNNEYVTPLHIVASSGSDELARLLLNKRASVNAQDYDFDTPLLEAVRHGHLNMCRILLSHGAKQTIFDSWKNLPIHYACQDGKFEILKVLIDNCKTDRHKILNWINDDGYSPLMLAVQSRNQSCVEVLLQFGADANLGVCTRYGLTSLHLAAYFGNLSILKIILKATSRETIRRYCSLKGKVRYGYKPGRINLICNALLSESKDCLEYLLAYGFDSDVLNAPFEDMNPITFVLRRKCDDAALCNLKVLLEYGYDANIKLFNLKNTVDLHQKITYIDCGPSPFYYFLYSSNPIEFVESVVYQLVEHGLDVDYFSPTEQGLSLDLFTPGVDFDQRRHEKWGLSDLFYSCINCSRFRLIPYLLQRTRVVEPHHILNYVLVRHEMFHESDLSILIVFLSHFVDASNLPKKYTLVSKIQFPPNIVPIKELIHSDIYLSHMFKFPSLKGMARSAIRKYIHGACGTNPHQFKVKLNSLPLHNSILSYLNYDEMLTFYKSLEEDYLELNTQLINFKFVITNDRSIDLQNE